MLKLYIYGYLNRVQSSRRLERESGRNVEVMWLTEDGLERTFALNHMAYFVITDGLRERLLAQRDKEAAMRLLRNNRNAAALSRRG
jgi:Transposase domain (DUF772)